MSAVLNVERRESGLAHLDRTSDDWHDYPERVAEEEQRLEAEFTRAVMGLNADDRVGFSRRPMTVAAVMYDAMDSGRTTADEAMAIVQRIAKKGDVDAQALVQLLARSFAAANAEVGS